MTWGVEADLFLPGNGLREWFRDHRQSPDMVVIPAGDFLIGMPPGVYPTSDEDYYDNVPGHIVSISKPFALGRFNVSFDEWAVAAAAGAVRERTEDWGCTSRPTSASRPRRSGCSVSGRLGSRRGSGWVGVLAAMYDVQLPFTAVRTKQSGPRPDRGHQSTYHSIRLPILPPMPQ